MKYTQRINLLVPTVPLDQHRQRVQCTVTQTVDEYHEQGVKEVETKAASTRKSFERTNDAMEQDIYSK